MSDGDSDYELTKTAFLVEDDGNVQDIDFTLPPTSGMEYLRRVRWETKHSPSIVTATIDERQFRNAQTVTIDVAKMKPAPPGCIPSAAWQKLQSKNFSELRMSLYAKKAQLRNRIKKKKCLPKMDDIEGWCTYCLGNGVSTVLYDNSSCNDSSEQTDSQDVSSIIAGCPPLLSVVLWLPQITIETLLSYHISWLKDLGFSHQQGRWIFGLLSCLEKPLTPNTCALLRSFARLCADLRSDGKHDEFMIPLNLIICIIADYFEQKDMIDSGENE